MEFRKTLFWDVDPKTIDTEVHACYIIERILDFGNDKEVKWVYETYSHSRIREVVDNPRRLHPNTRALWNELIAK